MKGYVRLKEPDEEVFLGEGAGCVQVPSYDTLQYRVWDKCGITMFIPSYRLVTIRLGPGTRPDGYEPIVHETPALADQPKKEVPHDEN